MEPTPDLKARKDPPSKWWGDAAIAALLWIVFTYLDRNSYPEDLPKPQHFMFAFFLLVAAWHAFLYRLFVLLWLLFEVQEDEARLGRKISELPPGEARAKALELLKDPLRFHCSPGPSAAVGELTGAAKELFTLYSAVEAKAYPEDVWLDPVKAAGTAPAKGFRGLGKWFEEDVLARRGEEAVYQLSGLEHGEAERERTAQPSIFHWVVFAAGRLE